MRFDICISAIIGFRVIDVHNHFEVYADQLTYLEACDIRDALNGVAA